MDLNNIVGNIKTIPRAIVILFLSISIIPPFVKFLMTGNIDYWTEAFRGVVVPWWVGFPGMVVVIIILVFVALNLEGYL